MALIEREAAIDALACMAEFRPILLEAWEEWLEQPAKFRVKMTGGARATIVHDLIVGIASHRLSGVARVFDKAALKLFVFGEQICIRFKKHDQELAPRNQPTKQVMDFLGQRPLDGVPAVHHLEVGYVLDPSETQVVSTNMVCPNGHKNRPYWHVELKDEGYQCDVTDLFDSGLPPDGDSHSEEGSKWKSRESGVVIPFTRIVKPR